MIQTSIMLSGAVKTSMAVSQRCVFGFRVWLSGVAFRVQGVVLPERQRHALGFAGFGGFRLWGMLGLGLKFQVFHVKCVGKAFVVDV